MNFPNLLTVKTTDRPSIKNVIQSLYMISRRIGTGPRVPRVGCASRLDRGNDIGNRCRRLRYLPSRRQRQLYRRRWSNARCLVENRTSFRTRCWSLRSVLLNQESFLLLRQNAWPWSLTFSYGLDWERMLCRLCFMENKQWWSFIFVLNVYVHSCICYCFHHL